ncbi:hypothetical protein EYF80_042359 [Liparis tanakae]|uniref:SOGA 1/2-like coiled-coil domain-containing protein n=1 Tax=Liparis tanakae TaxID=230148 RepID=A0A4Z2G1J0_9TELE|nr:hypothetical protein EYF80_042359 [Liparis tanakae]
MAAIDLERGLEHSGRAWGKERPELTDDFDSEMQEWEEQLQDIQQKIEELYNGVQARRGANDVAPDNQKNGGRPECGLGRHGLGKTHPGAASAPQHYSNGRHCSPGGYGYPVTRQNGFGCCHADSEIGDLLQDYLGQETSRRSAAARHVVRERIVPLPVCLVPFPPAHLNTADTWTCDLKPASVGSVWSTGSVFHTPQQ